MGQYRGCHNQFGITLLRIAIAGDLHGCWSNEDHELLKKLNPDGILFVGDLAEGNPGIVKAINNIEIPTAVILGNHDRGRDQTGECLKVQLKILGEKDCSWRLCKWDLPEISVVGARPCSSGGGFFLSTEMQAVFGPVTLQESTERIVLAAKEAPIGSPLVILAHSGPTGLGSEASSLCGRDWKQPAVDWGDKDLALAIDQIRKERVPELVVFGHTHHQLRKNQGTRRTFYKDLWGTAYLNAACVPRRGTNSIGETLCHLSWVEFKGGKLMNASHRWYLPNSSLAYEEKLM